MEPVPAAAATTPTPAPPPPPPAAPPVPPPPVPPPAAPAGEGNYAGGGILGKFDWVQILFLGVALGGIFMTISYYRKKAKEDQKDIKDFKKQLDELQMDFTGWKKQMKKRSQVQF